MPSRTTLSSGLCICRDPNCKIPFGYCHCKCGEKAPTAKRTYKNRNVKTGEPYQFIRQHQKIIRLQIEQAKPFKIDGVYCRLIPLSRGYWTIVWESDYEWLMQWKWSAGGSAETGICAHRRFVDGNGEPHVILMHRLIMSAPDGVEVDHKFGNRLDNRRGALRFANDSEQAWNRKVHRNNKSGFHGVSPLKDRWRSFIFPNGERKYLGTRSRAEDAARLYDAAAIQHFGEFARLNFPDERNQRLAEIEAAKKEAA